MILLQSLHSFLYRTSTLTSICCEEGIDEMASLIEWSFSSSCLVTDVPFFGLISDSSSVIYIVFSWGIITKPLLNQE